jgi:hypothetical protein
MPTGPSCRTLLQEAKLTCRNLKKIPQYPKMVHRGTQYSCSSNNLCFFVVVIFNDCQIEYA